MIKSLPVILLVMVLGVLSWSAVGPKDRLTWWLEVTPALVGLVVIAATHQRFRLTDLTLVLIAIHMIILIVGGHYTYAEVPLGFWMRDTFGFARNHYDRLGHFAQGFVPAIIARELLIRLGVVAKRGWLPFLIISICLAISATYELIEWSAAEASAEASEAFLGTQGDGFDTQKDMAMAGVGAICALLTLSRIQDAQMRRLRSE